MKIPKYWVKSEPMMGQRDGREFPVQVWGWSTESPEAAARDAKHRLTRVLDRLREQQLGDYGDYVDRAIREPILEEHAGDEKLIYVVTRNAYGSDVLNTTRAMFIDVDVEQPKQTSGLVLLLKSLFGGNAASQAEDPTAAGPLAKLRRVVEADRRMVVRVYRTFAGFRHLITSAEYEPGSTESERIMEALGADPLYRRLCRVQDCFRARLSPKPWRVGMNAPKQRYPFDDPQKEAEQRRWESEYRRRCEGYATAELVEIMGNPFPNPDIAPVVERHDEACLAHEGEQLA